jgi:putative acetyltransferase
MCQSTKRTQDHRTDQRAARRTAKMNPTQLAGPCIIRVTRIAKTNPNGSAPTEAFSLLDRHQRKRPGRALRFRRLTIRPAHLADHAALLDIWLRSVRATHSFLTEADIQTLLPIVRDVAFKHLELYVLCDHDDGPIGFSGLIDAKLEALFIDPNHVRRGSGRMLVDHARALKGPLTVDVNEQNSQAVKFYESCGFKVVGRSRTDSDGRPFPLLHMSEATTR